MIGAVVEKNRTCAHFNTRGCTSKRNEKAINWFITPELYQTNSSSFFWQKRTKKKQPPSWASRLTRRKSATNKEITMNGIYAHCLFHQVKIKHTIRKKKISKEKKEATGDERETSFFLYERKKKNFPFISNVTNREKIAIVSFSITSTLFLLRTELQRFAHVLSP